MAWIDRIADDPSVNRLAALLEAGGAVSARGICGSSTVVLMAALRRHVRRPILLVVGHLDEADEAVDELEALGVSAAKFPAMELLPGETSISLELMSERLMFLRRLVEGNTPGVIVAPIHALMQGVPEPDALRQMIRVIQRGDRLETHELAEWLTDAGYERVESIDSPGDFAIRGGIIDLFPPAVSPVRIDLLGDEVEGLFEIDLNTLASDRRLDRVQIAGVSVRALQADQAAVSLLHYVKPDCVAVIAEMIEIAEQGRSYLDRAVDDRGLSSSSEVLGQIVQRCHAVMEINQYSPGSTSSGRCVELPVQMLVSFAEDASSAVGELAELAGLHETVVLCQNQAEAQRMNELLAEFAPATTVQVLVQYLHRGFVWGSPSARPLALVPYHELLHRYQLRRRLRRITSRSSDAFVDLQPGDLVVHRDHGIAKFAGLGRLKGRKETTHEEFLTLEFAGRAKLHVPASKIELVQKYIGAFRGRPELSHLGGKKWAKQKQRVTEAVQELADHMLGIQAAREAKPGIRYPADTAWQREFDAEFPYQETDDQLAAIAQTKRDMTDARSMDRLICGDVGFGKTEIAIRAAFKAAEYGKQVAVLVPTTVLAEQHQRTFGERFADYPFRIESISRFKTKNQQHEILKAVAKGHVDIIIGTHRLLSKDVGFADLGLVIIDEEQRFGVQHKQRLLAFRMTADVLTLSATPIPRTLHMALLGLRDISSLATPPLDRRAIVTEVIAIDPDRITRAIERELAREGQVFFVHNRVHNIQSVADQLHRLVPEARVLVGHGQMPSRQLEAVMLKFLRQEADVLVCTTIIESGIDIPTTNTMFINDAHRFGLSELHQLRGRVGRYKHRAYCYLMLPADQVVSEVAMKRLRAIEQFSMLGAGFKIALRDLEIRGAGNLLGPQQSGHIAAVGYDMYCRLLEQSVADLKKQPKISSIDTAIDIAVSGALPGGYIRSDSRRMEVYRRISRADGLEELRQVESDLTSAYGALPGGAQTLLRLAQLRVLATMLGIRSITRHERDIILTTNRPEELERLFAAAKGTLRVVGQPDAAGATQVYYRPPVSYLQADTILNVLLHRFRSAVEPAETATAV
ncbi:MAG: transcription-repair coupling factor [Phycisphaerales bacterium]